jgi:hypothetical protein
MIARSFWIIAALLPAVVGAAYFYSRSHRDVARLRAGDNRSFTIYSDTGRVSLEWINKSRAVGAGLDFGERSEQRVSAFEGIWPFAEDFFVIPGHYRRSPLGSIGLEGGMIAGGATTAVAGFRFQRLEVVTNAGLPAVAPPNADVGWILDLPYYALLVVAAAPVLLRVRGYRARRRGRLLRAGGLCHNCGYDLRGSASVCPECGTEARPMLTPRGKGGAMRK